MLKKIQLIQAKLDGIQLDLLNLKDLSPLVKQKSVAVEIALLKTKNEAAEMATSQHAHDSTESIKD